MSIDFMFFVFAAIILVLFVFTRSNKDSVATMVVSFLVCNAANFEYVKFNFQAHLIEVLILELIAVVASFLIVKIVDWITASSASIVTFISELIASVGLVFIFYNIKNIVNFILMFFNH